MSMLLRLWYRLVGEPHPEKVVKGVNKALAKLEQAAAYQEAKAIAAKAAAEAAALAAEVASEVAAKSTRIRTRLGEIFEA